LFSPTLSRSPERLLAVVGRRELHRNPFVGRKLNPFTFPLIEEGNKCNADFVDCS
jgi:hypothetical protein